ncbi:hypothetical protein B0H19DRAFT_1058416 [Mycena capillaripes]|nr:hypothetical protein B0H19DRAFT_1058416 [Mycena capillaripes]
MIPITTLLTKRLGLKTPIISAPMGSIATPEMAAAVTMGGGLGCFGAAFDSSSRITSRIEKLRALLGVKPGEPVPLAVGLIGWILDTTEASEDPHIPATLDAQPTAIWLAFGSDLSPHIAAVRAHDTKSGRHTFVFVQIGTVEDALKYAPQADCIVVQGNEAGGHGSSVAPPLLSLLQAVLTALPAGSLVVAAGGISSGAQIASLLTMGAHGVVLGTRFLFTPEKKPRSSALLRAGLDATVRTLAFDEVGRTMGWPDKHDGRGLRNKIIKDVEAGLSLEERLALFDESAQNGEEDRLIVWAGVGAGMTNEIKPTAEVLRELHEEAVEKLRGGANLFGGGL